MNAARYIGNGALEVVDTEAPQPSPGEVQLEVAYTGICGTDLHILHGAMDVRVTMPAANFWLYNLDNDKYFAAPPGPAMKASANLIWKGWSMVTYPDQPSWSNQVVAKLIQGKSLSSLLPGLGKSLSDNAKAAGYKVVTKKRSWLVVAKISGLKTMLAHATTVTTEGDASWQH
jgi:hypothetical protein